MFCHLSYAWCPATTFNESLSLMSNLNFLKNNLNPYNNKLNHQRKPDQNKQFWMVLWVR